jgi:hypothetical protein
VTAHVRRDARSARKINHHFHDLLPHIGTTV